MITMDFSDDTKKPRKPREPRREHDAYMTPMSLVEAIVKRVFQYVPNSTGTLKVIEPACGDGEFVKAIRVAAPEAHIAAIDIRPEVGEGIKALGARFVAHDFLTIPSAALADAELIIGNPPYSLHTQFIGHALDGMRDGATLAFLLRFNMLVGSLETQAWWLAPRGEKTITGEPLGLSPNRQIIDTLPIFPRPSFTGTGTDATEYMLCIMRKGFDNGGRFDPVKWDKPVTKRGRKPKTDGGQS